MHADDAVCMPRHVLGTLLSVATSVVVTIFEVEIDVLLCSMSSQDREEASCVVGGAVS